MFTAHEAVAYGLADQVLTRRMLSAAAASRPAGRPARTSRSSSPSSTPARASAASSSPIRAAVSMAWASRGSAYGTLRSRPASCSSSSSHT
ncbi:hypothetical protein [Streptosporangium nondiastaticum]|uniref:hypothetical protein n=1 Tax=Streptosporangium nondiastaticum TaxID=35764 RepID=UPI0025701053|nr:hypothetical protein [Streptosporangium nondiastaticum]